VCKERCLNYGSVSGVQDFEVNHGNEETFRDMLRVKRTVQTAFSQVRTPPSLSSSLAQHHSTEPRS
jgi:hypothetical protein